MPAQNPYRLPRTIVPRRYEIHIEPDLDAGVFDGTVRIDAEVEEPTRVVVLNAVDLDITYASIEGPGGSAMTSITYDSDLERAAIEFREELPVDEVRLNLEFNGALSDKLSGFYRSTYTSAAGTSESIGVTQFEATDARRAFPCFDEPDFKAVFSLELVIPQDMFAVANGRIAESTPLDDGRRLVRFEDTMVMSTYIVAWVIGHLEQSKTRRSGHTDISVICPVGHLHLTGFALDAAESTLSFHERYYGIPFDGDKLDMVAVPDFAFGAMENHGCVTYREALLLLDEASVTQSEKSRVADVIAHELAHMWFGNYVTMRWWNGIWLNEAFATFMELHAVDDFAPAWERWKQFTLERSMAFTVDGLVATRPIEYKVESPSEADGMFDVLTYQKGASVLRMLEQHIGAETFRDGIRRYLADHAHSNTETSDLWAALEDVSGAGVGDMMDTWIYQGGYPIIHVSAPCDRRSVTLGQSRFLYRGEDDGRRWIVPISLAIHSKSGVGMRHIRLNTDSVTIEFDEPFDWLNANAGGHGFYRVDYESDLVELIIESKSRLDAVERFGLVDDLWANVLSGGATAEEFWRLCLAFRDETRIEVWRGIIGGLSSLSRIFADDELELYREGVREVVRPTYERLGWEPIEGETDLDRDLRGLILDTMGSLGADVDVRKRADVIHTRYLEGDSGLDADVVAASIAILAAAGDEADHVAFGRLYRTADTPQERLRYLFALVGFDDPLLFADTLALTTSDEVRIQDAPFLLSRAMTSRERGADAWHFIATRWDDLVERFEPSSIVRMLAGIRSLADPLLADAVAAFFDGLELTTGRKTLDQYLEMLEVNRAFRERERGRFSPDRGV